MLKNERYHLLRQIKGLEELNNTYILQDSIRINEIKEYENQVFALNVENVKLSKKLKLYKKIPYISGGIIATLLGILICR